MSETLSDRVASLVAEGFDILMGPHRGGVGYYCTISKAGDNAACPECENDIPMNWTDSGHGLTLKLSVINAREVYERHNRSNSMKRVAD